MSDDTQNDADDLDPAEAPRRLPAPPGRGDAPAGFFHIYKRGRGYWTRLCSAFAALGLLLLVASFVYTQVRIRLADALASPDRTRDAAAILARNISLGIAGGIVLIGAFFAWRALNGPRGADFLITTDSEMKKVNWASRRELFGSTRVVIIFLVLIASFLFAADIVFSYFFYLIGVLRTPPF